MEKKPERPEFVVKEPEKLVSFYENVFGWKVLEIDPLTGQWFINLRPYSPHLPPVLAGAIRKDTTVSTSFIGNFEVESLEETTRRVIDNGGIIYVEEGEAKGHDTIIVEGIGTQRYFCDPEDNMFGAVEFYNYHKP